MEATKSHLIVYRRSGERTKASLSSITIHQESEILLKLYDLADSKGIEVAVA
jgi:hypothetical protein